MNKIAVTAVAAASLIAPMTILTKTHAADATRVLPTTMHLEEVLPPITRATGSFAAINGVKRSFTVDLKTTWDGKTLTLVEDFEYNDGEKDRKTWRFTKTGPNTYVGTREDVIGTTTLTVNGKRATFAYDVYLDSANQKNKVRFRDTLVLREDGGVDNTAIVYKFGLPVAKVNVDFEAPSFGAATN